MLILIEICLLVYLLKIAKGSDKGTKVIISILIFFMFMGYTLRSIILLVINPKPRLHDSLADSRLIVNDNYSEGLTSLHLIVVIGILGLIFGFHIGYRIPSNLNPSFKIQRKLPTYLALSLIGLFSLILSQELFRNPITISLTLILIPSLLLVSKYFEVYFGKFIAIIVLIICLSVSLFASVFQSSKSPFFGFLVGYTILSENNFRLKFNISKLFRGLFVTAIGLFTFIKLQATKGEIYGQVSDTIGVSYFGVFHDFYIIVQRFDLLKTLADAKYAIGQEFLSPSQLITYIVNGIQWNWNSTNRTFGQLWASEISSLSDVGNLRTGTSLSTGFIAEGWLVGGYLGVFTVSLIFMLLTRFLSSNILKSEYFFVFGVTLICNNIFFERGLVGLAEGSALGAKVLVIFYLTSLIHNAVMKGLARDDHIS